MTTRTAFAIGVSVGAWFYPIGKLLGCHIAGRHELDPSYRSENHQ